MSNHLTYETDQIIKVVIKGGDKTETESYCYHLDNKEHDDIDIYKPDIIKLLQVEDNQTRANKSKETELRKKISQYEHVLEKISHIYEDGSKDSEQILHEIEELLVDFEA